MADKLSKIGSILSKRIDQLVVATTEEHIKSYTPGSRKYSWEAEYKSESSE